MSLCVNGAVLQRRLSESQGYFLKNFAYDNTSQGGEDGIIEEVFRLLSAAKSNSSISENCNDSSEGKMFCCDIGAWDGIHLSNTHSLLNKRRWGGILIEANIDRYQELSHLYSNRDDVMTLQSLVSFDGDTSLVSYLTSHSVKHIDFLTIDVDGNDYHIWKSMQGSMYEDAVDVVCIEFNPTISNTIYYIQERNMNVQHGSSLLALVELATSMNYTLIATTTFNAFFIQNKLLQYLPMDLINTDINALHVPYMSTEMFQTYDGELKYVGTKKLLWHRVGINSQKLQMLPVKDRSFPYAPLSNGSSAIMLEQLMLNIKEFLINLSSDTLINDHTLTHIGDVVVSSCKELLLLSCYSAIVIEVIPCFIIAIEYHINSFCGTSGSNDSSSINSSSSCSFCISGSSNSDGDGTTISETREIIHKKIGEMLRERAISLKQSSPVASKELYSYSMYCNLKLIHQHKCIPNSIGTCVDSSGGSTAIEAQMIEMCEVSISAGHLFEAYYWLCRCNCAHSSCSNNSSSCNTCSRTAKLANKLYHKSVKALTEVSSNR